MAEPNLQPDVPDVLQEEAEETVTVPVCLVDAKAPVRVQQLPRKGGATMTRTVTTTPWPVLRADHRRGRAILLGNTPDTSFLVAFTEAAAQAEATMALWPSGVPLEIEATTDVWLAVPADPGTSVVVSVLTYLWAEGEGGRG
jgi:hypothetical protein